MRHMRLNVAQKISVGFLLVLIVLWLVLFLTHTVSGPYNYLFSFLLGLMPLAGGIIAMQSSGSWKGMKGFVGRGIFFMGLSLFFWGCGELTWSYYNVFQGIAAPYPSLADFGYAPAEFFYCIGAIYLARAAGADFGLKKKFGKLFVVVASVAMFLISYYLLVIVARQGILFSSNDPVLKSILDIMYPLGDFISLTLAIVISGLSFKFLVGEYKLAVRSLLFGLAVIFVADMIFSYTTTRGTYFNGDFGDLLFGIALFLLTFGVLGFCGVRKGEEGENIHIFNFLKYS